MTVAQRPDSWRSASNRNRFRTLTIRRHARGHALASSLPHMFVLGIAVGSVLALGYPPWPSRHPGRTAVRRGSGCLATNPYTASPTRVSQYISSQQGARGARSQDGPQHSEQPRCLGKRQYAGNLTEPQRAIRRTESPTNFAETRGPDRRAREHRPAR